MVLPFFGEVLHLVLCRRGGGRGKVEDVAHGRFVRSWSFYRAQHAVDDDGAMIRPTGRSFFYLYYGGRILDPSSELDASRNQSGASPGS
jgi:hypothetical protein